MTICPFLTFLSTMMRNKRLICPSIYIYIHTYKIISTRSKRCNLASCSRSLRKKIYAFFFSLAGNNYYSCGQMWISAKWCTNDVDSREYDGDSRSTRAGNKPHCHFIIANRSARNGHKSHRTGYPVRHTPAFSCPCFSLSVETKWKPNSLQTCVYTHTIYNFPFEPIINDRYNVASIIYVYYTHGISKFFFTAQPRSIPYGRRLDQWPTLNHSLWQEQMYANLSCRE